MIKIKDVEIYHSGKKVNNDIFLENNENHKHFLEDILGKKERYVATKEDTVINMMKKVSKKIMDKNNLKGEDIDMIIAVSQTPEYFAPPMSAIIHNFLNIKEESVYYDINVACIGMNFAFNQCSQMLLSNKNFKRALIVTCDLNQLYITKDSPVYGNCGDLSCAAIIEKDDTNSSQLIDTLHFSSTNQVECITLPNKGFSSLMRENINNNDMKFIFKDGTSPRVDLAIEYIEKILKNNNLEIKDIDMFCFSQFAYASTLELRNHFNISKEKSLYIGDKYGYTSGSSPFIVLYESIKQNKIKRGDLVLFWTIGTGVQGIVTLIKY